MGRHKRDLKAAVRHGSRRSPSLTRRQLLTRFATLGGSTAVGMGLGELLARVVAPPEPMMRLQQLEADLEGTEKSQFLELIENDPELFWRLVPNVTLPEENGLFFGVISNTEGLREAIEVPSSPW